MSYIYQKIHNYVCINCGSVENLDNKCTIYGDMMDILDNYLIPDLNKIIIEFIRCGKCNKVIHKKQCCSYMCQCKDECDHFTGSFS